MFIFPCGTVICGKSYVKGLVTGTFTLISPLTPTSKQPSNGCIKPQEEKKIAKNFKL